MYVSEDVGNPVRRRIDRVALKLSVPDTIKPFLLRTEVKGVYGVADWTTWLNRRFAKVGMLRISAKDQGDLQFTSKILGVVGGKGASSLIVDNFVPEPDPAFFSKPQKLTLRLMYVEWGFEISTTFEAVAARKVTVKGNPAVELVNIEDLRIRLSVHITSLGPKSGVEMGLFIRGTFTEVHPNKLSLNKIWFGGKLPDDIGPEGIIVDKASIKLGADEPDMMFKVRAIPERTGDFIGELLEMEHISKLANFIEQRWSNQASRLARESGKIEPGMAAGQASTAPKKVEDYLKPHLFLLGEDEQWVERLNKHGVCVPVPTREVNEVFAKFEESRCDVIIGDADYWDSAALIIAQEVRGHEKYSQVPMFWIAGPDNIFSEANGQDLIDLGAYDFLDRTIPESELEQRFEWMNPKLLESGNGPILAIVTPENRQQYRFGLRLRSPEFKVVKINTHETGVVSRLIETNARWIAIDVNDWGETADRVIMNCLEWSHKGHEDHDVFLIPACIFVGVRDGKIVRIDEYLDTAQANRLRALTGRTPIDG